MFDDVLYTEYNNTKEPFRILRDIHDVFDREKRLLVAEYYVILGKEYPPEAENYVWLIAEQFKFGKKNGIYYIQAEEPIEIYK